MAMTDALHSGLPRARAPYGEEAHSGGLSALVRRWASMAVVTAASHGHDAPAETVARCETGAARADSELCWWPGQPNPRPNRQGPGDRAHTRVALRIAGQKGRSHAIPPRRAWAMPHHTQGRPRWLLDDDGVAV
jgi:hypothetical protein